MGMEYGHKNGGYSQETAAAIDAEIRRLVTEAHERATKLLQENRSILDNMSRVLVEKETIYTEEVRMLMEGASYKEVIEKMERREGQHEANPFARVTPVSKEHVVSETESSTEKSTKEKAADLEEETPFVEETKENNDSENN
jgi:cell division protease FtsH